MGLYKIEMQKVRSTGKRVYLSFGANRWDAFPDVLSFRVSLPLFRNSLYNCYGNMYPHSYVPSDHPGVWWASLCRALRWHEDRFLVAVLECYLDRICGQWYPERCHPSCRHMLERGGSTVEGISPSTGCVSLSVV